MEDMNVSSRGFTREFTKRFCGQYFGTQNYRNGPRHITTNFWWCKKWCSTDRKEQNDCVCSPRSRKWNKVKKECMENRKHIFEAVAYDINRKGQEVKGKEKAVETSVWDDGIALSSDFEKFCAFRLIAGKKYRVTVEELEH